MKRFLLCFLAVILLNFVVLGGAHATPIELREDGSGLIPDNVWSNGEVYSLLGGSISLAAGHYDLTYSLSGKVWHNSKLELGWEGNERLIIRAFLNDTLIGSTTGDGLDGQHLPFRFSLSLDFDLERDGLLDIIAFSETDGITEYWTIDMNNTSMAIGSFDNDNGGNLPSANPVPEPATMLLLASGLVGLAGFGRKKFF